jgi:hypothetical protein
MVANQERAGHQGNPLQCTVKQEVSPQSLVVSPDDAEFVLAWFHEPQSELKQFSALLAALRSDGGRNHASVSSRGLDRQPDFHRRDPLSQHPEPGYGGFFTPGEHDFGDAWVNRSHKVRQSGFDHPPHAAGPEVVMNNDQTQV